MLGNKPVTPNCYCLCIESHAAALHWGQVFLGGGQVADMSVSVMDHTGQWKLRTGMVAIYWAAMVIGQLNYGAVQLHTVALFCVPVFASIAVSVVRDGIPASTGGALVSAAFLLALSLVWVAIQSLPLPHALFAAPAWQDVSSLSPDAGAFISLSPGDDWGSALRIALPLGVFILSLLLFDRDDRALGALKILAASAGIVALLSILQFELAPDTLLFWTKQAYLDSLTGFFVNRNTAATYFGLMVVINLALFLHALDDPRDREDLMRWWFTRPKLPAVIYGAGLSACLIALMLTKSRAGLLSCLIAIACLLVCRLFRKARSRRRGVRKLSSRLSTSWINRGLKLLLIAAVLFLVVQFLGGRTLLRAEVSGVGDTRYCVMPGIMSAIANQLPFGAGLASFEDVFPAYRDARCGLFGVWNRAHNVYLEGLFTFGIVFVLLATFAMAALLRFFVVGLKKRRAMRLAPETGIAALALVAVHSFFDFSLQISGLAVIFSALLGPLVTISLNPPGKSSSDH